MLHTVFHFLTTLFTSDNFWKTSEMIDTFYHLSFRMKNLLNKHNGSKVHPYKNFVVTLTSSSLLKKHKANLKTQDSSLHTLLVDTCKYLVEKYDCTIGYTCNNELHLGFHYNDNGDHLFDGNINKLLSSLASSASYFFTMANVVFNESHDTFSDDPSFSAKIVEFNQDHDILNYFIYRQNYSYNNNLVDLYRYFTNTQGDVPSIELIEDYFKQQNVEITKWLLYGTFMKKELILKKIEKPDTSNPLDSEDIFIRKNIKEWTEDFSQLVDFFDFENVYTDYCKNKYTCEGNVDSYNPNLNKVNIDDLF
jgi:hypothetical protein